MSKVHLARSGFITKAALPSITRQRGTTTGSSNLMLFGAGKTTVSNNTTFIDSSTNAFTVTRVGDTVHSGHNPFSTVSDGSAYFDGTGDYVTVPANAAFAFGTGDFTIEYWIYSISYTTTPTVVDTRNTGVSNNGYSDYFSSGGNFNLYLGNTTVFTSSSAIPTSTWTHIAVSRSGTSLRVFINGVQSGSTLTNSINFSDTNLLVAVNRGTFAGTINTAFFNGYVSNVRIVKGAAVYTSNFTPSTSALTAITNTSLLLLTDNYSIVNSTPTPLPVTINGDTTISTAQYPTGMTRSIYFDGTGDYLTIPNGGQFQFGTGNFTVEWFQYQTGSVLYPRVFSVGSYPSASVAVSLESGFIYYWANGVQNIRAHGTILNTWVHFAISRLSNVTKIFKNGVQLGADITDNNNISDSSTALSVGSETTLSANSYYSGYISNLRFAKGTAIYTANFTTPSAPLSINISVPNNVTNAIYGVNQLA